MLHFDRIDVSEGIDVNNTIASKECIICHYQYFLDNGFKFQPDVCNGCHDVLIMSINLNNISILNICRVDCACIITRISTSESVNLLQNAHLSEKSETLHNDFSLLYIKNWKKNITFGDIGIEIKSLTYIKNLCSSYC